ncbi:hypothetical protein D8I24_2678 (plasmid) [Cupriavidus necator H850]|nr:hypothetical protein D8I24_2678 [Cupriavidus necator H850]
MGMPFPCPRCSYPVTKLVNASGLSRVMAELDQEAASA